MFSFILVQGRSQESGAVTGRVIDSETKAPISFATLRFKNKSAGVITNANGDFQLPIRYLRLADTVIISCIGYNNKLLVTNQLLGTELNTIKLTTSATQLGEIQIRAKRPPRLSADRIIELAIERIPINYPKNPFSYLGYYRDYQLEDKNYINLNESIVEVFDSGFISSDPQDTKISLYEYRKNESFPRDPSKEIIYDNNKGNKFVPDATLYSFGGNELSILRIHDAIRNNKVLTYSFVNIFSVDFINNHFFKLKGTVLLHETPLYCISFESKFSVTGSKHNALGTIYIEKNSFAIHKMEYATYEKNSKGTNLLYELQLEYAKEDGLMYLNYISFNNIFKIRNSRDFRTLDILFDRSINAFVVKLNNEPEETSVANKDNYSIKFDHQNLEIRYIDISQLRNDNLVYVYLADRTFLSGAKSTEISSKLNIQFGDIKDKNGRRLNNVTFETVSQFRELFSQKRNTSVSIPSDLIFMSRDKPISQNEISPNAVKGNYWMNTPLKAN
jgi:hypothetical protein